MTPILSEIRCLAYQIVNDKLTKDEIRRIAGNIHGLCVGTILPNGESKTKDNH